MTEFRAWKTPDGVIVARIYESYMGLCGQQRLALVDKAGRVFHYDYVDVKPSLLMKAETPPA